MLSICPPDTNGQHLYPFDAYKYVQCNIGMLVILSCPTGSAYNFCKNVCLPVKEVKTNERVKFFTEITTIETNSKCELKITTF